VKDVHVDKLPGEKPGDFISFLAESDFISFPGGKLGDELSGNCKTLSLYIDWTPSLTDKYLELRELLLELQGLSS